MAERNVLSSLSVFTKFFISKDLFSNSLSIICALQPEYCFKNAFVSTPNRGPKGPIQNVSANCTRTWKQVASIRGLCPSNVLTALLGQPSCLVHQAKFVKVLFAFVKLQHPFYIFLGLAELLLILAHDVETNPGPDIEIHSYNARGLKEYEKLKRLLNYFNKTLSKHIGIVFLQETHLNQKDNLKMSLR